MKKSTFKGLIAMAVCNSAAAAGIYDGIYQLPNSQEFYSVHQSGSGMIVGGFSVSPASGINSLLRNGQLFTITKANIWDLFSGSASVPTTPSSIVTANLQGEVDYGACSASINVVFSPSGTTVRYTGYTQTSAGVAQGVNCSAIFNSILSRNGGLNTFNFVRIF